MQVAFYLVEVLGKLSLMLVVLGVAVLFSQAVWAAFILKGAQLVRQRQPLTLRDVVLGMGEDGVWLAYLLKRPTACVAAVFAGIAMFRLGNPHPGWVGIAAITAFIVFGPVLRRVRRSVAAMTLASAAAVLSRSKAVSS